MVKNVINKNKIIINIRADHKDEVFKLIAQEAFRLKIVNSVNETIKGFKDREKESSTGFENGFAIPHTRIAAVIKPALFYIKLAKPIIWPSMDWILTDTIIAILVPEGDAVTIHLELLSKIAVGLLNEDIKKELKHPKIKEAVLQVFHQIQTDNVNNDNKVIKSNHSNY